MYIVVLILALCLWLVSTMKEGVDGAVAEPKKDPPPVTEGGSIESRLTKIEQTLQANTDQIKDVIMKQLPAIV